MPGAPGVPRRLLFLHAHADWRGGAPQSIATWARCLRARGVDVVLAAPGGPWLDRLTAEGFRAAPIPRTDSLDGLLEQATPLNAARLAGIVHRERPDAVVTFQYGSHLLARLVCEPAGVPWVHAILGPLSPGQRFAGGPYAAVAPELAADVAARGGDRVLVWRGRLDLERFQPLPPPTGPLTVGFASRLEGRLVPVAEGVAQAFSHLASGVRGVIAGDGPALTGLAARYPRVTWRGQLAEIRDLLRECHVWVAAGRTLAEGLAVGRPAVSFARHGLGGAVHRGTVERVAAYNFGGRHVRPGPLDPLGLAQAIREALTTGPDPACTEWVRAHLAADVAPLFEALRGLRPQPAAATRRLLRELAVEKARRVAARVGGFAGPPRREG